MSQALRRVVQPSIVMSTVVAVVALSMASTGTTAAAEPDRVAAKAATQWLTSQLGDDGTLRNPLNDALPDHGLMIDLLYAAHASGAGAAAEPVVDYLDDQRHASDYFTWDGLLPGKGFDAIIVGGYAAKVLVAAEVAGRDPRSFGGWDMVAETKAAIMRSGPHKGRVSSYSKNPDFADFVSNDTNIFGQALAVIGLAGVADNDQLAIDKLVTQQCAEGYFRIFFGVVPTTEVGDHVLPNGYKLSTCDEGKPFDQSAPDNDATAMGLSALLAAREAGATGLDAPIDRAVAYLSGAQTAGGGWGGGVLTEAPNTNSTGLVVQVLTQVGGHDAQVDAGMAYIKSAQVGSADAENALAGDIGAIAYNPQEYQAAKATGVSGVDTWIRAGAQAALGLAQISFYDLVTGNVPDDGEQPPITTTPAATPTSAPTTSAPVTETATATRTTTVTKVVQRKPVSPRAGTQAPPPNTPPGQVVLPVPTPAEPPTATPSTPTARLAGYLAARLVDGDHIEVTQDGRTFVDYDGTADVVFALRALGEQQEAADSTTRFLLDPASVAAYAHGVPYEPSPAAYAEPLAKLRLAAGFLPDEFGKDIADLDLALTELRTGDGTFVDTGKFADASEAIERHVWATTATIAASDSDAGKAVQTLLDRQCRDGTFPVDLSVTGCGTGDLTATAVAITALNAGRSAAKSNSPANREGWSPKRSTALEAAAAALNEKSTPDGTVRGGDGQVDVVLTSAVATARTVAGLDSTPSARALAAALGPDGGVVTREGTDSNLPMSVSVAPGLAARSWLSAEHSPVVAVLRLPLRPADRATATAAAATQRVPAWMGAGLVGLGFLLAVTAAVAARLLITRNANRKNPTREVVSP
ncbi:hypothetical protein Aglo03_03780 [Actinokineospora globicatena]|uniref:Prenyltransferase and squalene oxidase repeat-containing protein n=2 Tax=Actinokineospora globicatena TaxID=103729 RepID=A0A9W6QHL3_9PSEU|nr:hypothetical protein Aglo03_03780 [Actinokineospora globicatena]